MTGFKYSNAEIPEDSPRATVFVSSDVAADGTPRERAPQADPQRHGCLGRHTDAAALLRCHIAGGVTVDGSGPWAVLAYCAGVPAAHLYSSREAALAALSELNAVGCSRWCTAGPRRFGTRAPAHGLIEVRVGAGVVVMNADLAPAGGA